MDDADNLTPLFPKTKVCHTSILFSGMRFMNDFR
jgi:hypothetical protein